MLGLKLFVVDSSSKIDSSLNRCVSRLCSIQARGQFVPMQSLVGEWYMQLPREHQQRLYVWPTLQRSLPISSHTVTVILPVLTFLASVTAMSLSASVFPIHYLPVSAHQLATQSTFQAKPEPKSLNELLGPAPVEPKAVLDHAATLRCCYQRLKPVISSSSTWLC